MGAGFCEMVGQQSGIVGEGMEFDNGEVPLCQRPGLVEEDGSSVLRVLNGFNRLGVTERKICEQDRGRAKTRYDPP